MKPPADPLMVEIEAAIDGLRRSPAARLRTRSEAGALTTEWNFDDPTPRRCGACTLCCKLLPIAQFEKPAGKPCPHQRMGQGCRIYASRPAECAIWSCRWLAAPEETAGMRRPDRAHFVIDPMFDEIRSTDTRTGEVVVIAALQVWCDPRHAAAILADPELRGYLDRMHAEHGLGAAVLRWDNQRATVLVHLGECWETAPTTLNRNIGNFSQLPQAIRERLK